MNQFSALAEDRLNTLYRAPEQDVLAALLPAARSDAEEAASIRAEAEILVGQLRGAKKAGLVEQFLGEYGLSSAEGLALMSMAEAYLRVPDPCTKDSLIRDKIGRADWRRHFGASGSGLVDATTIGLHVVQTMLAEEAGSPQRAMASVSAPLIRRAVKTAMRTMGRQFVLGQTIRDALRRAKSSYPLSVCSFDMLGEGARTTEDAEAYFESYLAAIQSIGWAATSSVPLMDRHAISVKLSALHPRYEVAQADICIPALIERLSDLAKVASSLGIGLTVDAEETDRLELSLDIIAAVARNPALKGWDGLGMAVQAYQKRASAVVDWASDLSAGAGRRLAVRLVKGAYWDTEIKRCQERGLTDYPVFTRKAATDVSYLACARQMLASPNLQPAFATHNAMTVAALLSWIGPRRDVEFQRLHGMGASLYEDIVRERGFRLRIYAPVGGYRDLLAYLVRRLLENGANSSFVHQATDRDISLDELLVDPVSIVGGYGGAPHPAVPLPKNLFGGTRLNSAGLDLSDRLLLNALYRDFRAIWAEGHHAAPIVSGETLSGNAKPVQNPADPAKIIGSVVEAKPEDVAAAIFYAAKAASAWSATPVETRAACLHRMSDLLERDRTSLMALLVAEAGKTLADAVSEVREAVDFCRYYAVTATETLRPQILPGPTGERNELIMAGRGVFACISPWNFPLAIFLGQITAALVTGNSVVAKPAPQTPLIAAHAVQLLIEAGIPKDAIHLVPGGAAVGQALVANPAIAGVVFTGSTGAAKHIARALLDDDQRPLTTLIAETGGLNAMIVDSTALPEQVVNDVIISAFQSAGQRCSALRLLCLQDEIADQVIAMLKGAVAELRIGDPAEISTDVGPLIDPEAQTSINAYLASRKDRILYQAPALSPQFGYFIAPTIIELDHPDDLDREVFGPVLHVVRWQADGLDALIDGINKRRYGLTMGVHSRISRTIERVRAKAQVGNLYINRSMIGAVVGVQPFGGEGLSGTGPKAGGPHYLARFCTERTLSVDTTSAGGNASLMCLE